MPETWPSEAYKRSVAEQTAHHARSKTFSGSLLTPHRVELAALFRDEGCRTILDYGCGKAKPWLEPMPGWDMTMRQALEPTDLGLFDPCVPEYADKRPLDHQWDMVILSHVLFWIPMADLREWVLPLIDSLATQAIFIVETIGDEKKRILSDRDAHPRGLHAIDWIELLAPLQRSDRVLDLVTEYRTSGGRVVPGRWRL